VVRRARGHEQHGEVVADGANFADERFRAVEDAAEFFAAMTMFEDANARAVQIPQGFLRAAQNLFREDGGAGRKVELPQALSSQ
jgi:hypothetical protein